MKNGLVATWVAMVVGYKINLLRNALEPYKDDDKKIVLFTDRYASQFDYVVFHFIQITE